MVDSESKRSYDELDKLFSLYFKIENLTFPISELSKKKTVTKYTRFPDDDLNKNELWTPSLSASEPRFRRIITIDKPIVHTQRSLRSEVAVLPRMMASDICKRKIVTIEEGDEHSYHPKFSQDIKKTYTNLIHRAIEADIKEEKQTSQRKVSRLSSNPKTPKDNKPNVIKKGPVDSKVGNKYKYSKRDNEIQDYAKNKNYNEPTKSNKNTFLSPKLSLSKKIATSMESEKEVSVTKSKYKDDYLHKVPPKKSISERTRSSRSSTKSYYNKLTLLNEKKGKNKPITIIQVPLDEKIVQRDVATDISQDILNSTENTISKIHSSVQVQLNNTTFKNMSVETDLMLNKTDQITETDEDFLDQCNSVKEAFDSLDIPNVRLTKTKNDIAKDEIYDVINTNASNLSYRNNLKEKGQTIDPCFRGSTSYIISRATLTYTTKQKIDFHVVGNDEVLKSHLSSSSFPLNVVSVFKKEKKNNNCSDSCDELGYDKEDNKSHDEIECLNDLTSTNSSYIFDNDKLVKPSDIISTIKVNNTLLQSNYISEQFQRELNFIDSFFESLQYLESCSLSDKCITDTKVENWIKSSGGELKHLEDETFLTKFENDVEDTKTMASRSLCLLNLLIRNEQRRAKNLLFVLKMREDALKNFTKSQILWLENKKGQENIDISTLKKKQRGALLKLQHECGEMQRMRKALLTLSEKRKLAFMKTKKNIELKLRNSADVEQIILGKKKLKRSTSADRNAAPLKCFELSSSGCDDSTTSRPNSYTPVLLSTVSKNISSAEKFVQTGEILPSYLQVDQSVETSDENVIVVDGGYLNILFRSLLPQIFSNGKQYEVNKEALNTIVHTSNLPNFNLNNDSVIGKLMEQIKNHEPDPPHTPSTARSLVEEFDQIYKDLTEEDISLENCINYNSNVLGENKEAVIINSITQSVESECYEEMAMVENEEVESDIKITSTDESCTCEPVMLSVETQSPKDRDVMVISVSGPLPVPAGEAAISDDVAPELSNWVSEKTSTTATLGESSLSSQSLCQNSSLASPVLYEAEELRRQQLAIEREIKALEQQQCQLLAVREIPDKPPPPYTPPLEPRTPKHPRKYAFDASTEQRVYEFIKNPDRILESDPYDMFLKDFCQESIQQQKLEKSEKFWDTCNFLSSKPQPGNEKLAKKTAQDLKEVLTSVAPTIVSGVGARRSDHIDDILFAEWRRCEPEWTSLHADEVIVKNQVFESIFQRILTETIDEYKKNIVVPTSTESK